MDISSYTHVIKAQNDLKMAAKLAHWSARGKDFYQYHKLFETVYSIVDDKADTTVELGMALGYEPTFEDFGGPQKKSFESYECEYLVSLCLDMATSLFAKLVYVKQNMKMEPMTMGVVAHLEELAQDVTKIMYLLSATTK
jgi:DNA-binding ferritin-like protein